MQAKILLGSALLVTVLLYWSGLNGPFILDDSINLESIQRWLAGQTTWQHVVFDNQSGMFGRSLSMATLALSAKLGGFTPFAFKAGNLLTHLSCGVAGWLVLRRAMARDPRLASIADLVASLLVALWLLHPINVSTVLYAVQRMAQLSTLFVLLSVWCYLLARTDLIAGRTKRALLGLFLFFPLMLAAGLLCKENAAVAPALCLVLELAYFSDSARSRILAAFYGIFIALPAMAVAAVLLLKPSRLLGGYLLRDYDLGERLLTQSRALVDYVGVLLLPRSPSMGVFTDDFATSTGWLSPPSTLLCIVGLLAFSCFAIAVRKRAPSIFAGWFFFLVAHSIESSILPLELYFEHRNYLPAFGLWLAVAGLCELATRNIHTSTLTRRQLGMAAAAGFALVFAFSTFGRVRVWRQLDTIVAQALVTHPTSPRANFASAQLGIEQGNYQQSQDALNRLLQSPRPRDQMLAHIDRVSVDCVFGTNADPADLRSAIRLAQPKLSVAEINAFEALEGFSGEPQLNCGRVRTSMIADSIDLITDKAVDQPDSLEPKWRLRLIATRLYARNGDWDNALEQAKLSWQPGSAPVAGAFLARAYAHTGRMKEAEQVFGEVAERTDPMNSEDVRGLSELREFLTQYKRGQGVTESPATGDPARVNPATR